MTDEKNPDHIADVSKKVSREPDAWVVFCPDGSICEKGISKHGPINAGELAISINYQRTKESWEKEGWQIKPVWLSQIPQMSNLEFWKSLSDEERESLMGECCECGSLNLRCQCWNDE